MNRPYTSIDFAMDRDGIESVYQTVAMFDDHEVIPSNVPAANGDPDEDYENLYLVPG